MRDSRLGQLALAARGLPLWARWLLTLLLYAAVIATIVAAVGAAGSSGGSSSSRSEAVAVAEANREGQIAIAEDQAPHTSLVPSGAPAKQALEGAITDDVRSRIAHGALTGPLQSVRCSAAGPPRAGRRPFRCVVVSASIAYPFLAVADELRRELTWCKLDPPPVADAPLAVPVSARCRL